MKCLQYQQKHHWSEAVGTVSEAPSAERDRFGTPEVKRTALGGRSSPTIEADSSASWKGPATRRLRTLQALSSPLSTYVPTVAAILHH